MTITNERLAAISKLANRLNDDQFMSIGADEARELIRLARLAEVRGEEIKAWRRTSEVNAGLPVEHARENNGVDRPLWPKNGQEYSVYVEKQAEAATDAAERVEA